MKLISLKNKKAQAALTDSLFFLTIVMALSVLLFKFSVTYGDKIDLAVNDLYFKEYTNSVLKSIYYIDTPLNFDLNVESSLENDYLITSIKSSYLAYKKIGFSDVNSIDFDNNQDIPKYNLMHTIISLMQPIPNYDYIFYIENKGNNKIIFFILKLNYIDDDTEDENLIKTKYYLCEPKNIDTIKPIVRKSNKLYSSSINTYFPEISNNNNINNISVVNNLTIWPSTQSISPTLIEEYDVSLEEEDPKINCKNIEDLFPNI